MLAHIRAIHAELRGVYGWPRMWRELRRRGARVGKERVRLAMRQHGIQARGKRRFRVATTDSNHTLPIAPNLLDRNFTVTRQLAQVRHERGRRWAKWLRIGSGYCRVCTTFALQSKMFGQADSELPEQRLLLCRWLGDPPQPDLAAIGSGQNDGRAL